MAMNYDTMFLLAKLQASAGVAADYDGTDLVPALKLEPKHLDGQRKNRETVDGRQGAKASYITGKHSTVEIGVEAAAGGAAGTAPFYGSLIEACGWAATVTADTSVAYKPRASSVAQKIATLVGGFGGISPSDDDVIQEILDAQGTLGFELKQNELPMFTMSMMGDYARPVQRTAVVADAPLDISELSSAAYLETDEASFASTAITLGGHTFKTSEFSFKDDTSLTFNDRVNCREVRRGKRAFTGRLVATAPALDDFDYFASAETSAVVALTLTHGVGAGSIVEITAPKVEVLFSGFQNEENEVAAQFDLRFLPNAGDDDLVITVK
jgi:hypothetical protein